MASDKDKKKGRDPEEPVAGGTAAGSEARAEDPAEPVVRDRRRIDPETGEARTAAETADDGEKLTDEDLARLLEEPAPASAGQTSDAAAEHLNDLKRVQAEYANYRKRVERDRVLARDLAIAEVLSNALPVLDDLDLADAHGDLKGGPLELVAQKLRAHLERYGLEAVGAVGETFDPNLHEAIAQAPSKDVTAETIAEVIQPGYRIGERLLRAAKVVVSVPEE